MNTIYKVVHNAKTGLFAVVSELQSSARKSGRTVRRSSASAQVDQRSAAPVARGALSPMKPSALALLLGATLAASTVYADPWEQSDTWVQWAKGHADEIHVYDYTTAPQRYSHINTDFYFGSDEEARFYQMLDITTDGNTGGRNFTWTIFLQDYNGRSENFAKKNQAANNTGMILAQSANGLVQQLIRADDLRIES